MNKTTKKDNKWIKCKTCGKKYYTAVYNFCPTCKEIDFYDIVQAYAKYAIRKNKLKERLKSV